MPRPFLHDHKVLQTGLHRFGGFEKRVGGATLVSLKRPFNLRKSHSPCDRRSRSLCKVWSALRCLPTRQVHDEFGGFLSTSFDDGRDLGRPMARHRKHSKLQSAQPRPEWMTTRDNVRVFVFVGPRGASRCFELQLSNHAGTWQAAAGLFVTCRVAWLL